MDLAIIKRQLDTAAAGLYADAPKLGPHYYFAVAELLPGIVSLFNAYHKLVAASGTHLPSVKLLLGRSLPFSNWQFRR